MEKRTSTWKIAGRCIIEHMHGTSEQVKDFLNRSFAKVVMEDYSQRLIQKVKGPYVVLESFVVWATLHYIIYLHPHSIIKQTLTECAKAIWNSSFFPPLWIIIRRLWKFHDDRAEVYQTPLICGSSPRYCTKLLTGICSGLTLFQMIITVLLLRSHWARTDFNKLKKLENPPK